ncbi:MAG: hypothetical protein KIT37_11485, partial [Steroidobacteraceae bacterium]|nr:hypothetical protein [Steroidobacteraceae bacterium]
MARIFEAKVLAGAAFMALLGLHGIAVGANGMGDERFVTRGIVQDYDIKGRTLWIELVRSDLVFMVDVPATPNSAGLIGLLDAAAADSRTVTLTYDLADGALQSGTGRPIAILRSIRHDGVSVVGTKGALAYPIASPRRASRAAELALARGVAFAQAARHAESIEVLDEALRTDQLGGAARGLAFKTRGNDRIGIIDATVLDPTPESDRTLIAAIEDFRAWRALAPGSADPLYEEAYALRDLGAYEEALAVYREIAKDKNERFWSSIRIAA